MEAATYLESIRWPDGPVCPHCGESERRPYPLKSKTRKLYKCAACRKQYTVTVGTIFEGSHIGLHKWLLAFFLLCSSKKGMSAHQLHRMLGVTYKSAWFMAHRIRYAMEQPPFARPLEGVVEADETYVGGKERNRKRQDKQKKTGRGTDKTPVVVLVERGGPARAFRMANVTGEELKGAIRRNVAKEARIMTDSFKSYRGLSEEFASHEYVSHSDGEYVRGEVHTNTAENYFSILKRGIDGTYHHISEAHLPRYLAEFDFRYNNRANLGVDDAERTRRALAGVVGKRLTYAM
ncbi:MAG TPA: IS1595 family transposase [Gaiellaceae bacterium]|nr:IS1595 family transposase [Gaiellaceae bacterium]